MVDELFGPECGERRVDTSGGRSVIRRIVSLELAEKLVAAQGALSEHREKDEGKFAGQEELVSVRITNRTSS